MFLRDRQQPEEDLLQIFEQILNYKSEETLAIQNNVEVSRQIFLYIGNHLQLVIPMSLKIAIIHNLI